MIIVPSCNPPESLTAMLDAADDASDAPIITVTPEVYNAILLAKCAMVVTFRSGTTDFLGPRHCLMTAASEPVPRPPGNGALLRCMVGG
jgi:hypothetical protein